MHSTDLRLWLVNDARATQLAEAAEHRLSRQVRASAPRTSVRRAVGRSLIRLGQTLAAEPEPALRPAQPR